MSEFCYRVCYWGPLLWFRELLFDEAGTFPMIDEFGSGYWVWVIFLLISLGFFGSYFRLPAIS